MTNWETVNRPDVIAWLLEEEDPSVWYFTLKDLLDKPEDGAEVQAARQEIMLRGLAPEFLARQREAAYQKAYPSFYTNKYQGLVWSLIVLAELGAQTNPQIQEQCEYLLCNSQELQDGGFSMHAAAKTGGGRISEVIPCLTGNLVWCLIRFGYLDDPRLQRGIGWLTRYMRFNDGTLLEPQLQPYDHYETCWGPHTCHMGVVKALKALGAIPPERRTPEIKNTIGRAAEFLLIHHIYKRSHDLKKVSKPGWLKFGFPLMYQTDVLEILDIMTALGIRDSRMEDAVAVVAAKQDAAGIWTLENAYGSDRLLVPFGQAQAPSKWITLRAMRVLKRYSQ